VCVCVCVRACVCVYSARVNVCVAYVSRRLHVEEAAFARY
jgi:hypothetical protein